MLNTSFPLRPFGLNPGDKKHTDHSGENLEDTSRSGINPIKLGQPFVIKTFLNLTHLGSMVVAMVPELTIRVGDIGVTSITGECPLALVMLLVKVWSIESTRRITCLGMLSRCLPGTNTYREGGERTACTWFPLLSTESPQ